jgi:hypothetical protein
VNLAILEILLTLYKIFHQSQLPMKKQLYSLYWAMLFAAHLSAQTPIITDWSPSAVQQLPPRYAERGTRFASTDNYYYMGMYALQARWADGRLLVEWLVKN